ncbi:HAMP domain-containing histidine kinase [Paenibacillus sp. N1-5-1-14]|uniref:sensor histidine kinase n=1 Tax=Paenibacillus radicibacter TaxID=2972488 RepID=UPI002158BBFC|nr:HAMP domain-containing sensor histidine kinase [Paenibacillus radicibacter]MCR8645427.1 HAMP domain-containing histidine kinase [Paenibacillus radicibacter]
MRQEWLFTVRWKLLLILLGSIAIAAVIELILYLLTEFLADYHVTPITWTINNIGSKPIMIVAGVFLFLGSFFWLSGGLVRDMKKINHGVQSIASGRIGYKIPLRGKDELGEIAQSINQMSGHWNRYLEEITHGLTEIAQGRFENEIPVHGDSKLDEVASSINKMSKKLHHSIQEERIAEKTKNDLITGVSHDLRTPLTSVLGFLEVIEDNRYQDEVELRYYVNIAYEKALTLRGLIDNLFEYTRINNGMPLKVSRLDMSGFLRQVAEELVPIAEGAGMMIRVNTPQDGCTVIADGDLLVRAYENLITNAIQYGQSGKYVDIDLHQEDEELVVSVINYGDPIPERDLPFIFDRFYRVESSRSKLTGGTGLGLAITKSIIEVHGGKIAARSDASATLFETRLLKA